LKKIPNMIVRPLPESIVAGRPTRAMAFAIAGWIRFLTGTDEDGRPIPIEDPLAERLTAAARQSLRAQASDPAPFLALSGLFGEAIAGSTPFAECLRKWLDRLQAAGTRASLRAFLRGE